MRKLISIFLLLSIIANLFPATAYAAGERWADDTTVTYGGKKLPLDEYDPGKGNVYFSNNGGACTKHTSGGCSNCKEFEGASQCLGFAIYVQYRLFGCFYRNYDKLNKDKFDIIHSISTESNDAVTNIKKTFENVKLGAHIRVNNSKFAHSMIFVKSDAEYVWTYEANIDYRCRVRFKKRTWKELNDYLKKYNLKFIASPKAELFDFKSEQKSDESKKDTKVEKKPEPVKKCTKHAYNGKGYCKECEAEFKISVSSMSGTYQAVKNDVPVRKRPYSSDKIIKNLAKGEKVEVVGSAKNSAGNVWYKIKDGTWIYSGNLEKAKTTSDKNTNTSNSKSEEKASSVKIAPNSYPGGNLEYGKDFTLTAKFTSDCAIVEARAYLLDSNKNVIMEAKGSSTTSNYYVEGYALDKGMKFDQLSPGGYYLKYYAKDANGDTATWTSDKFYIVKKEESQPPSIITSICKHSYDDSGYCSKCRTEFVLSVISMNAAYQTVKDDVPVRNRPYAPDKIIKNLAKGTKVTVIGSAKNSQGNLWYKIKDGTWIFSGNLEKAKAECKHTYNDSGYCTNCKKEYPMSVSSMSGTYQAVKDGVPVRNRPYAPDKIIKELKKGTKVEVVASGKNSQGNLWYKIKDGTWIFSGNLEKAKAECKHSYNDSGYCTKCKKEYPIKLTSMSGTYKAVKDDVPVRNRPYAPDKTIKKLKKGAKVEVIGSAKNSQGNLWYKLKDGTWVYSGNLKKA